MRPKVRVVKNPIHAELTMSIRILLLNPPIYDFRFDWSRWHQPCGLLQVGSLLRKQGNDVRLIDCLQPLTGDHIQRKKIGHVAVEGVEFIRWHFGWSWEQIERKAKDLKEDKWIPEAIFITCMMTFWWEATRDIIQRLKQEWFPRTRIVLGGVYPSLCPDHAKGNIPGVRLDNEISKKAKTQATDFSLYDRPPRFVGIFAYRSRSAKQIVDEIENKSSVGVRDFAFFDNEIPGKNPQHFERILDLIIERRLDIKLRALGNLSPKSLTRRLISKMREAGYRQIYLRDDVAEASNVNGDLSAYEQGIDLLLKYGGYKPRTDDVTAMVLVGLPGENLEHTAERLIRLAHVVGSVNLVPYQPTPGTAIYKHYQAYLDQIPLELQNGKLFPFAKLNNASLTDYQELIRLATLLNSKYRSTTFDFLGNDEISRMVRQSIAQETWKPKIKETLPLLP